MKKEEAKAAQEKDEQRNELTQRWDCVEWEQARIELWGQELAERKLAVAVYETAVFQCELEYWRLKRCPLCGRRGRGGNVRGQQAGENDEVRQRDERRWREVIVR